MTSRRTVAMAFAGAIGVGMVTAAALDQPALVAMLAGLVAIAVLFAVVEVRQAIAREAHFVTSHVSDLESRVEAVMLAVADQGPALLASIDARQAADQDARDAQHTEEQSTWQVMLKEIESERRARADRQLVVESAFEQIGADIKRLDRGIAKNQREQTSEVEALLQLFRDFDPRAPMPPSGGWALNPMGLLRLSYLIDHRQPRLVLELGSGTSSIWIAYAVEKFGGRLITFDHKAEFAERTRSQLAMHELSHVAEVRHASLREVTIDGEDFDWYNVDAFDDIDGVNLLVVDGPPGSVGPAARYPALRVLEPRLAADAVVVLDDVNRPEERNIARRWIESVAGLSEEEGLFGKQVVLRYSRPR